MEANQEQQQREALQEKERKSPPIDGTVDGREVAQSGARTSEALAPDLPTSGGSTTAVSPADPITR